MLKILIDLSWHDEPNLPALYQEEPFFLQEKSFQDDIMAMGLHNLTVACFEEPCFGLPCFECGKYVQHFFGVIFQPYNISFLDQLQSCLVNKVGQLIWSHLQNRIFVFGKNL